MVEVFNFEGLKSPMGGGGGGGTKFPGGSPAGQF